MDNTPPPDAPPPGDRIAKVLARAGIASRRDAERMIEAGRVTVNGRTIDSPALNIGPKDRVTVDGKPLAAPEPARLWLYHKPSGLVTTTRDELDRRTIFDDLPEDMPRVLSVGRLDLNSEGLLLLTNDGGIKRKLELPATGWLRKYRVRINGRPKDEDFAPLRQGLTIEGDRFQPMSVTLDRQQGANAWLTIGLREGKNREIRRAIEDIGFTVNRLIRVSYGPFQLGTLKPGAVEEVRRRVMRDQLGMEPEPEEEAKPQRPQRARKPDGKPGARAEGGKPGAARTTGDTPSSRGTGPRRGGNEAKAKPPESRRDQGTRPGKPGSRAPGSGTRQGKPGAKPGGRPGSKPGPRPGSGGGRRG